MLLSSIIGKRILSDTTPRGVCTGVGISLKTLTVKYLLCCNDVENAKQRVDFALPFSCVTSVDEVCVHVSKARAVFPKTCAYVFLQKPVFSFDGVYFGRLRDFRFSLTNDGSFTAATLYTDTGETFAASGVYAFSDAVILKKDRPYPLGQRIPAPIVSHYGGKNQTVVSKTVLRRAIEKSELIKLTLSLPPFNHTLP